VSRLAALDAASAADVCGRRAEVAAELAFVEARREQCGRLLARQARGEIPERITHNDTKINNVMLDDATGEGVCVIDLDTVMPGLAAYDFGDSLRFGAASAAEDEEDLSRMRLNVDLFETYTRGYLAACENLTRPERETLPLGAFTMTLECGVRFLTDYLDGDRYFKIHRPDHNLIRCRTQFTLAADIRRHMPQLSRIVFERTGGK